MKKKYKDIITAILTIVAFTLNFKAIYNGIEHINKLFIVNSFVVSLILLLIIYFYWNQDIKLSKLKKALCFLCSFLFTLGTSYYEIGSWGYLFDSIPLFLLSVIRIFGYYYLFCHLLSLIDNYKFKIKKTSNKIIDFIDKKPFVSSLIFILIFWLIYIIAFYPGLISRDASFQILQFFNIPNKYDTYVNLINSNVHLTNHHPVIHTLLIGYSLLFGRTLGSDNFGIFIYTFIQMLILSGTLAYSIKFLKKLGVNKKVRFGVLLIYSLLPMYPFYSFAMIKDTIYSSFVILYVLEIFNIIKFYDNKKLPVSRLIYLFVVMIFMSLFRNNGIYIIYLSFPILLIYRRKYLVRELLVFIIFVISMFTYNNIILPHFEITPGSIREVLSIPFQQTARLMVEDEKIITNKDRKVIGKVLDYNFVKNEYDPEKADNVKNTFNKNATDEDVKNYFEVWFKYLLKRPDIYIQATLNNTYGYFSPFSDKRYIYDNYNDTVVNERIVDYSWNGLEILRMGLIGLAYFLHKFPITGLLTCIGFAFWILLYFLIELIEKKKCRYIIVLLPLFISILICIASPVNEYFRYTLPYMFIMSFLLGIYIDKKIVK